MFNRLEIRFWQNFLFNIGHALRRSLAESSDAIFSFQSSVGLRRRIFLLSTASWKVFLNGNPQTNARLACRSSRWQLNSLTTVAFRTRRCLLVDYIIRVSSCLCMWSVRSAAAYHWLLNIGLSNCCYFTVLVDRHVARLRWAATIYGAKTSARSAQYFRRNPTCRYTAAHSAIFSRKIA